MRELVLAYLGAQDLGTYAVSNELPYSNAGTDLHMKNVKSIYVDRENKTIEEFMAVMNGHSIYSEVTTVRVLFANDSKRPPSNYSQVVLDIIKSKDFTAPPEYFRREADVQVEHEGDIQVTEIELTFTKIIKE